MHYAKNASQGDLKVTPMTTARVVTTILRLMLVMHVVYSSDDPCGRHGAAGELPLFLTLCGLFNRPECKLANWTLLVTSCYTVGVLAGAFPALY